MNKKDILNILQNCLLPDTCNNSQLLETHISWIILTDHFAFKIKKPVKLPFLDFSTPGKRKYFCYREVELNKRLEPEMYIDVITLKRPQNEENGAGNVPEQDYAVQMKRMDGEKQMYNMFQQNQVNLQHLTQLAHKIAGFHKNTKRIKNAFNTARFQDNFADLEKSIKGEKVKDIRESHGGIVNKCIAQSQNYLNDQRDLFNERIISGFQRDCHGDLNVTNIFLYDEPVIFDCIEFTDDFRFIDILDEIATLVVDLDFFGNKGMGEYFYQKYLKIMDMEETGDLAKLFAYYKSYRANVRAKVTLINLQNSSEDQNDEKFNDAKKYIELMESYTRRFYEESMTPPV